MKILFASTKIERSKTVDLEKYDPDEFIMLVDLDRCIRCGACALACQLEHGDVQEHGDLIRPIILELDGGREEVRILNLPLSCRHCNAPCEYHDPYNFWITCPRGREKEKKLRSCDACLERTEAGFWPACATRCSMKTIFFGFPQDIAFTLVERGLREMGSIDVSQSGEKAL